MTLRLHPRGAVVAALGEAGRGDDVFRRLGIGARRCDLGDESLYLAEELVDADEWIVDPASRQALGALILALMVAQRQGSTCLPLDPQGPLRKLLGEILALAGGEGDGRGHVRALEATLRIISNLTSGHFSSVIGLGHARLPLVVDAGALYTERALWLEERVAAALCARLREPRDIDAAERALAQVLAEPGGAATLALTEEQRQAVAMALSGSLAIITGGPGTGKTAVAAAIVRGLIAQGARSIALTAPTGKAAQRLGEVIGAQLGGSDPLFGRPTSTTFATGQTVHRLLGVGEDGARHHARSPLGVDAVIVDEASMLDLELMDGLLDALPPRARLILIGDARQLPAVDAGQVMADLVAQGQRVARLTHSFRMDASDPRGAAVLAAANAIDADEPRKVIDAPGRIATVRRDARSLTFEGVEWLDSKGRGRDQEAVAEALWRRVFDRETAALADLVFRFEDGEIAPEQAPLLEALAQRLSSARLLTVTRGQATGSVAMNRHLHDQMLARLSVGGRPDWVPGEPVMITANDYQRGLFNGDQGIVARVEEPRAGHRFRALFRVAGKLTPFSLEAIRDRLELSWAMTVHKSQGSEMDAAALILPVDDLPLLTRELIYTGLTRARRGAAIVGARQIFLKGCARSAQRHTGLPRRLAGA
ncbi:MAG: exodeoxyribonuclease V subunit alpha [Myxococcales bacterium]|nr:exodeoxyribonuclease V subunit alpha [Myxococcales bacterium]